MKMVGHVNVGKSPHGVFILRTGPAGQTRNPVHTVSTDAEKN